jgi:ribosomal protein S25
MQINTFMRKSTKKPTKNTVQTPIIIGEETAQQVTTEPQDFQINGNRFNYFMTSVYKIERPDLLPDAKIVAKNALDKIKKEVPKMDPIFLLYQTHDILDDPMIVPLAKYIVDVSFDILAEQGYDMSNKRTYYTSMWVQEHFKHSAHEEHIHNAGAQIVGFYFLDVPPDSSRIIFHDPRPGKKQINLPETNMNDATYASDAVNFLPKKGDLYIVNAWTPHSISRNHSTKSVKFIHFTINVDQIPQTTTEADTSNTPTIV